MRPDGSGGDQPTGTEEFQILPWDSGFFGFSVARILPQRLEGEELARILDRLRELSIRLVYWADGSGNPDSRRAARAAGGRLVDLKTTFQLNLADFNFSRFPEDPRLEEYPSSKPTSEMDDLAIECGRYSRFNVDPGIGKENYRLLYRLWLQEALAGKKAQKNLVYRGGDNRIEGMICLAEESATGRIVLISVRADRRGRGIGQALCAGAASFFLRRGREILSVVTQGENLAACGLYKKLGFRISEIRDFYHFWL